MSDCDYGYSTVSYVYLGNDNAVSVIPYSDIGEGVIYDMTGVTNVIGTVDLLTSTTVGDAISENSSASPSIIFYEQLNAGEPDEEWRIHFRVGRFTGIVAGEYRLRITLIDSAHPNGLVLTNDVLVTVVDDL